MIPAPPRGPHWDDRADLLAWLTLLLDILEDSFATAEDITRDENDRTLGRLAAREAILAAHTMAKTMVTRAIESAGRETSGGLLN
jgi:hypothetical protein